MANSAYRFSLASASVAGMAKILQTLECKEQALKAGELAKLLGVTRQHIYKMAAASVIPSFRIGAAVRFAPKQVAECLTRRMPQDRIPLGCQRSLYLRKSKPRESKRKTTAAGSSPLEESISQPSGWFGTRSEPGKKIVIPVKGFRDAGRFQTSLFDIRHPSAGFRLPCGAPR